MRVRVVCVYVGGGVGVLLIRLVTREEHKSTHSIRDFIPCSASVKVKCWRISQRSIIVCNFTYGPTSPCCCSAFITLTEVTYEASVWQTYLKQTEILHAAAASWRNWNEDNAIVSHQHIVTEENWSILRFNRLYVYNCWIFSSYDK